MSDSMVERVAKAICLASSGRSLPKADDQDQYWSRVFGPERDMYLRLAREAIAAMREPTEAMIAAGFDEDRLYRHPSESWPAMVDAALAEGKS